MGERDKIVGKEAAVLTLTEIGWGSLLHGFRIPLAGHLLSLNQSFLLTRALRRNPDFSPLSFLPAEISQVAALLKCLSPMGKRLTPMLAISMQGWIFSGVVLVLGANLFSVLFASLLLSLWGFFQPILISYLFLGNHFIDAVLKAREMILASIPWLEPWLFSGVLILVILKMFLSLAAVFFAWRISAESDEAYRLLLMKGKQKNRSMKLPFSPLYLLSFGLTFIFLLYSEKDIVAVAGGLLRPLAVAVILYFAIRLLSRERILAWINQSRWGQPLKHALKSLEEVP